MVFSSLYLISVAALVDGQVSSPFGSGSWRRQEIDGSAVGSAQLALVLFVRDAKKQEQSGQTTTRKRIQKRKKHKKRREKNGNQVFPSSPSSVSLAFLL